MLTIESTSDSAEAVQAASGKSAGPPAEPAKPAEPEKTSPGAAPEGEQAKSEGDEGTPKEGEQEPERRRGGFQRRIDKLTAKTRELEAQLETTRRQLAGQPAETPAAATYTPAATEGKPILDNFETYEVYIEALTDWKTDQKLKAHDAEVARQVYQQQQTARLEAWEKRLDTGREAHEDYDEVLADADLPISQAMQEAMIDSEAGAELAYWLAKNPDACTRIAKLGPLAAARELGKIEASFSSKEEKTAPRQEQPKVSSAPKPITPVGGKPTGTEKDPDKMDYPEYKRWREAGGGQ